MNCTTITASRACTYPPMAPRKTQAETEILENDISDDVDCEGLGVSIITSVFTIHPDDDDTTLTLGTASFIGLVTSVPYSGGTPNKTYRIENAVTTSNGLSLVFTVQVSIAETVKIAFGQ